MHKRFPRKAKKWAKKHGVELISASGKTYWYNQVIARIRFDETGGWEFE